MKSLFPSRLPIYLPLVLAESCRLHEYAELICMHAWLIIPVSAFALTNLTPWLFNAGGAFSESY